MNPILSLSFAVVVGLLLGTVFFGGLWMTVRNAMTSKYPAVWFGVSVLVRTAIVLIGFYFVAQAHPERLIASLVGFVIARFVIIRLTRSSDTPLSSKTNVRYDH